MPGRSPLSLLVPVRRAAAMLLAGLLLAAVLTPQPAGAAQRTLTGTVASGKVPLGRTPVTLYRAAGATGAPRVLGNGVTDGAGTFTISYRAPRGGVLYVTAGTRSAIRLAAVLGPRPWPRSVVVSELTTAAAGFALAQFTNGWRIGGPAPGPRNASLMARNLADPRTGRVSPALLRTPNGNETTTLATFRSVANMLAGCARSAQHCARLERLARTPGGRPANGALDAVANIAKHPWQHVKPLFALSLAGPRPYRGALRPKQQPPAWTLPVRFVGDGRSIDGPGNFAIDAKGNVYVANNYVYGKNPVIPRCGSKQLPKFKPDGRYARNAPFTGGGLDGAGYGITLDPRGNIWVANYGFAAPAPKCPERRQPNHRSISKFSPEGRSLAGRDGIIAGDVFWPQGMASDRRGDVWIANCGNGVVTRMPSDAPQLAVGYDVGLEQAFDVAVNHEGTVYATGLGNSKLAVLNPDGTLKRPLFGTADLGLNRPMGIASDSRGNMWIANSGIIGLPCPEANFNFRGAGGSLSLVGADGRAVTHEGSAFTGGGLTVPWGIAVDGDDNVWVANFFSQRISQFCGVAERNCRPGGRVGDPISPNRTGYRNNGLVRITAVQIDPSGNVWAANNWKRAPIQTNPGGYEVVVFVGAAAPLKTPVIGTPAPLMP